MCGKRINFQVSRLIRAEEYDWVCFFDSDMLARRNIDHPLDPGADCDILCVDISLTTLRAAAAVGINWIDAPVSASGRLELTRWLREQSVSETRHRYGNQVPD